MAETSMRRKEFSGMQVAGKTWTVYWTTKGQQHTRF
jgi:hypothetical protein